MKKKEHEGKAADVVDPGEGESAAMVGSGRKTPALPPVVAERGLTWAQWNTLCRSLYPGADPVSVILVVDYCKARNLDPMKKPCHIVPMRVKDSRSGKYDWRDVVMQGVSESRITAHRTNEYLGHSAPTFGPEIEYLGVTAPEWCEMTMYRWSKVAGARVEFPVRVYFREVVATAKDKESQTLYVNERWTRAPRQMLTKCTEAAGLREAFPEELGGEPTYEEVAGHIEGERVQGRGQAEGVPPASVEQMLEAFDEEVAGAIVEAFESASLSKAERLVLLRKHGDDSAALLDEARDLAAVRAAGRSATRAGAKNKVSASDGGWAGQPERMAIKVAGRDVAEREVRQSPERKRSSRLSDIHAGPVPAPDEVEAEVVSRQERASVSSELGRELRF